MQNFVKKVLGMVAVLVMAYALLGVLLVVGFGILVAVFTPEEEGMVAGSVLVVDLSEGVRERPVDDGLAMLMSEIRGEGEGPVALRRLLAAVEEARVDADISGLVVIGGLGGGYSLANVEELRRAIVRFGEEKPSFAWVDGDGLGSLYLKSAANEVYAQATSLVTVAGLRVEQLYLGALLERVGLEYQVVHTGAYKTAGDMYTERAMSAAEREQLEALLEDIWATLRDNWAMSRAVDGGVLDTVATDYGLLRAEQLAEYGLVDGVMGVEEWVERVAAVAGYDNGQQTYHRIAVADYLPVVPEIEFFGAESEIAVVYVEGEIVGAGDPGDYAAAADIVPVLRQVREDERVKAVVVRVNSPGGGLTASEQIAQAVKQTAARKPVVVSMGGMAASGGYYVSAHADEIILEPTTVTGSIGVVGLLPNAEALTAKIGVKVDAVQTHERGGFFSAAERRTEREMQIFEATLEVGYAQFLATVAEGRGLALEAVREVAGGRIWSGRAAVEAGLADGYGGLGVAIQRAADLAGIGDAYEVSDYPAERTFEEQIAELFQGRTQARVLEELPTVVREAWHWLKVLEDPKDVYVLNPTQVEVH